MIQLYINPIYNELETHDADYNDICPDNELRAEIESYLRNELWDEEAQLEELLKHEPQN